MDRLCTSLILLLSLSFTLCRVFDNEIESIINGMDDDGKEHHWALLVAGSNGYYNYRHQADICHAYQLLLKHGFAKERIITMMFDDIANNPENPTQGKIINHPDGPDVYQGVVIDYKGKDVIPETFLAVMQGNEEAVRGRGNGRVIKSGPNDHVFVNFADHGAPGILAFPMGELHAQPLMNAILNMHEAKQFKQMVFYIEACESGSMFKNLLPKNISVYATTAANDHESSYACYFDKERKTYLGDVYSVKWMEDSDKEDLGTETLHKQFQIVKEETNTSHVMQYGEISISDETVSEFQSGKKQMWYMAPKPQILPEAPLDAVPSEQVPMAILSKRLALAVTKEEEMKLTLEMEKLVALQQSIDSTIKHIVGVASKDNVQAARVLGTHRDLTSWDCYEAVARHFDSICFDLSQHDYAMRRLYTLVNLCEEHISPMIIMEAMDKVCMSNRK